MAAQYKLRVEGAAQVAAVCSKGETVLPGARMKDVVVYQVNPLLTSSSSVRVSASDTYSPPPPPPPPRAAGGRREGPECRGGT